MSAFGENRIDFKLLELLARGDEGEIHKRYRAAISRGLSGDYLERHEENNGYAISITPRGMRLLKAAQ